MAKAGKGKGKGGSGTTSQGRGGKVNTAQTIASANAYDMNQVYPDYAGTSNAEIAAQLGLPAGQDYTHGQLIQRIADVKGLDIPGARQILESAGVGMQRGNVMSQLVTPAGATGAAPGALDRVPGNVYGTYSGGQLPNESLAQFLGMPAGMQYTHGDFIGKLKQIYGLDDAQAQAILEGQNVLGDISSIATPASTNPAGATIPQPAASPQNNAPPPGNNSPPPPPPPANNAPPPQPGNSPQPQQNQQAANQQQPREAGVLGKMWGGVKRGAAAVTAPGSIDRGAAGTLKFLGSNWKSIGGIGSAIGLYNYGKGASDDTQQFRPDVNPKTLNSPGAVPAGGPVFGEAVPPGVEPENSMSMRELVGLPPLEPGQSMLPQPVEGDTMQNLVQPIPAGTQPKAEDNVKPPKKAKEQKT